MATLARAGAAHQQNHHGLYILPRIDTTVTPPTTLRAAPYEPQHLDIHAWKNPELGTHRSGAALAKAVQKDGFRIGDSFWPFIKGMEVSGIRRTLGVANISPHELGFPSCGAPAREIIHRALYGGFGLELLPLEAAFQLRREFPEQQEKRTLVVATELLLRDKQDPSFPYLINHDGPMIALGEGSLWSGHIRIAFGIQGTSVPCMTSAPVETDMEQEKRGFLHWALKSDWKFASFLFPR